MPDATKSIQSCSLAAWAVLMSPVRAEIAEALRLLGAGSIAEIAQVIDRPADTLYRHIATLQKHALVLDAGLRKTGRNAEQLFRLAADDFAPDFTKTTPAAANRAVHGTASTMLKAMERTVRDAAAAEAIDPRPGSRNMSMNYELGWLTPEAYQEMRALIGRMKALMDESKLKREGRLYMTLALACPVVRKRGARTTAEAKAGPEPVGEPRAKKAPTPRPAAKRPRAR